MSALKRKLKSRRGASSIIALLFFVVAMMVGAVVLSSAGTNAGRASHALKDQQEYYAVESAVSVISGDLEDTKIVIEISKDLSGSEISGSRKIVSDESSGSFVLSGAQFKALLLNLDDPSAAGKAEEEISISKEVAPGIPAVKGKATLTMETPDSGAEAGKPEVNDIILAVELWAEDKDGKISNPVTIKYSSLIKETKNYIRDSENEEDIVGYTEQYTLSWYQQSLERGASSAGKGSSEAPDSVSAGSDS